MPEPTSIEIFELGDFQLSTGFTLNNAKLAYRTHGSLNEAKDNAVLFPHFLAGSPDSLEMYIGEGRPFDPRKYFIILPGLFGGGLSSSPSNTSIPFNQGNFPDTHIADDVIAQHRLLTEKFGIQQLKLVLGWSVGALQTYEWAVRFPDMVKRAASIAGAPKPSPWTVLWLRTVIEEPIIADPGWNNGFYTDPQAVQAGLRRVGHGAAMTLPQVGFYRDELWRSIGFSSVDDFVARFWEAFWLPLDPNNLVAQARKTRTADPSGGGDIAEALGRIKAEMFVYAFTGDRMFQPEECKVDSQRIPNAKFEEIGGVSGHLTTFGLTEKDRQVMDEILTKLLTD
ncbi:alpha/beta hydrolase fold protein [Gloeothece citriformis PCC 7424]|uniref:Alpha/beta hydrolase fold protein n=1 Tax=Gloeothece citriformis (strain PCC 7424) TaxID=65393 RepID=B7KBU3_GLOC7|nr:alpha/beta fold hydrolase [Gloeothece citriformis]ACK73071.1 alpha/beta hydrolase fold protein [Gloeothece citriformis PCC 7424]